MKFGKRLQSLRMKRGLSLKEASGQIGVPVSTYREWEYGRKILGEPYPRIAEVFQVSLNELFGIQGGSYGSYKQAIEQAKQSVSELEKVCESLF